MAECDGDVICPWDLDDCLEIHEDIDHLIGLNPKDLCNSRCWKWFFEKSDGGNNGEEMRETFGTCQGLGIEPVQAGVHVEGKGKAIHGCCWGTRTIAAGQPHDVFKQ